MKDQNIIDAEFEVISPATEKPLSEGPDLLDQVVGWVVVIAWAWVASKIYSVGQPFLASIIGAWLGR